MDLAIDPTIPGIDLAKNSSSDQTLSATTGNSNIYTYHCACLTHILTTPYDLLSLPIRALPSLDKARILPIPLLDTYTSALANQYLPSLLHNLRPARKAIVVQREDGYEKRKMWWCGRCGCGIGYELDAAKSSERRGKEEEKLRIMYLLEDGLTETTEMMRRGEHEE